tara:strand:+ start:273 stop:746 length:474 start_codon:yes stop_codon:yes gene_type:complete
MKSAVGTQSSFKIASQNSSSRPRELRKIASQSSVSTLGGGLGAVVGRVRANSAASKAAQLSPADAALRQMLEARPSVQVLPRYVGGAQKFNSPELKVRDYTNDVAESFEWSTPEFVVVASDGVLDAFASMQDMVTFVKDKLVGTRESFADVQVYIYF